jgi:A/G-specific adenine glycosylase
MTNQEAFRRSLLRWYRKSGRDLPWRRTRDPYVVLVSEMMLQQTQVAAVLPYYRRWLERFPDFKSLARASENDVLVAWQGLGYYRRARNLRATAKLVSDRYGGRFPASMERMRQLPGIGRYTAHAVACFAFDQPVPIVEANTARVLARLFDMRISMDEAAGRRALWNHAASLLPKASAHHYNSALIDLGALVCLPRPRCGICPVKRFCSAAHPETLPVRKTRPRLKRLVEDHAFVLRENRILLQQAHRRWRGMWILPPLKLNGSKRSDLGGPIHTAVFPFTHHRVTLRAFPQRLGKTRDPRQRWFPISALDSIPMPSPHRRALTTLLH